MILIYVIISYITQSFAQVAVTGFRAAKVYESTDFTTLLCNLLTDRIPHIARKNIITFQSRME